MGLHNVLKNTGATGTSFISTSSSETSGACINTTKQDTQAVKGKGMASRRILSVSEFQNEILDVYET